MKPKNTICLWFGKDALEAARFYAATFPDSEVTAVHNAPMALFHRRGTLAQAFLASDHQRCRWWIRFRGGSKNTGSVIGQNPMGS